jgi:hypothetical protein
MYNTILNNGLIGFPKEGGGGYYRCIKKKRYKSMGYYILYYS